MSLTSQYVLSQDTTFRQKVLTAIVATAEAIQSESPSTTNHTNRSTYARAVLNGPDAYVPAFALAVADVAGITSASTDTDISNAVSAIWDGMAGVL